MKKIIILSLIGILILTGCDASKMDTLSCTYENSTEYLTTRMTYDIDYQNKDVKKLRVTYKYNQLADYTSEEQENNDNSIDGVGTGTDGTTSDDGDTENGIVDGIVGSAIDSIINSVTDTILNISGLRDRHSMVQNTYGNMAGFSVQNTDDMDDRNYTVTYIIDYDAISDDDLNSLNLSRDIDTLKSNYTNQGFTCR